MFTLIFIIALILLLIFRFWWTQRKIFQLSRHLKSDIVSYPFIGICHLFMGNGESLMKGLETLGRESLKQGGIVGDWFGYRFIICISDPALANFLSRECLEKIDIMRNCMGTVLGNCHLLAPVPIWRHRRKIANPLFNMTNIRQYLKVFETESKILTKNLEHTSGRPVLIFRSMLKCTMEILCQITAGINLDLQNNEHSFVDGLDTLANLMGERFLKPWMYADFVYELMPEFRTLAKIRKEIFDFIHEIITKQRSLVKEQNNMPNDEKDKINFLAQFIEASGDGGYTDEELREEALVMIGAGTDTTAIAASFCVSMLARRPDAQEEIYNEVMQYLGADTEQQLEKIMEMKYLDAFIKETMRLFPPTPIVARTIESDIKLPTGMLLPENCGIILHLWAINRNKQYWGPDADTFRPERFLDPNFKNSAAFSSFSLGPRNCIGQRFAMLSLKVILSTLARRFKVLPASTLQGKPEEFRFHYGVTLRDAEENPVILKLRK